MVVPLMVVERDDVVVVMLEGADSSLVMMVVGGSGGRNSDILHKDDVTNCRGLADATVLLILYYNNARNWWHLTLNH